MDDLLRSIRIQVQVYQPSISLAVLYLDPTVSIPVIVEI